LGIFSGFGAGGTFGPGVFGSLGPGILTSAACAPAAAMTPPNPANPAVFRKLLRLTLLSSCLDISLCLQINNAVLSDRAVIAAYSGHPVLS
jgi:hypothetical protein